MSLVRRSRAWALALAAAGCGAVGISQDERPRDPFPPLETSTAKAAPEPSQKPARVVDPRVTAVLEEVADLRRLPIKSEIKISVISRKEALERAKKKVAEELPAGVLTRQGDALRALELIPTDYELEAGLLALVSARIAGFYDPDDKAMFLLDDLASSQDEETLSHELIHALQDQSFEIGPLLDYAPGQSDRITAAQHLVEGDATVHGFLHAYGEDFVIDYESLRSAFYVPTAMSSVGAQTPPFLIGSLVSPYVEGYTFVEALRRRGGTSAIDQAFGRLPISTEQILHPEKYRANEKPSEVPALGGAALGADFKAVFDDTNGELGLRLMLEEWTSETIAATAAAGWGGDRMVVFEASSSGETRSALAFVTRMDSENDAIELEKVVQGRFGRSCQERSDLGPLTWKRAGKDVILAAGPFKRDQSGLSSAGSCAGSKKWLAELSAAK